MLSPYRNNPNNTNKRTKKAKHTISDNDSHHEPDDKRPQMTSERLKQNLIRKTKKCSKSRICAREY